MSDSIFKLSAQLLGHNQDVKALAVLQHSGAAFDVLSCSRDATARRWPRHDLSANQTYASGQSGFLNAVATFSSPDGQTYILTAGADTLIQAWPLSDNSEPTHALVGHVQNVCCLKSQQGLVYSGSWDKTAKIWKDWNCFATLGGHQQAVWDVLPMPDGSVLTAAADNLIRFYDAAAVQAGGDLDSPSRVLKGHSQPVRALVRVSDTLIASAGNDGTVRLWDLTAFDQIRELGGHDSFVYSLSYLPATNELVSGGEDRSVRVWSLESGELKQTITLPAISVWAVAALPDGDIAAGTSDGAVRIFSRSQERWADEATLKDYDATLSGSAINPHQVGDVKKTDLPGPEALFVPGTKEGQVKMIKLADGSVEAHQWSMASREWVKIGTVVDAVGQNRKQLYEGQEYDFVFDVDVEDGKPPLKLPYNATQNPYDAAQRFLARNELPQSYVDEVVKFIEKNSGGIELGTGAPAGDPYTGGQAYRSSTASQPGQSAAAPQPVASTSAFPYTVPLKFQQTNLAAMRSKIGQLNDQLGPEAALSAEQVSVLDKLITSLLAATMSDPGPNGISTPSGTSDLLSALLQWPASSRFPAIDLIRTFLLYAAPTSPDLLLSLAANANQAAAGSKDAETNSMLALRGIANTFGTYKGAQTLVSVAERVLSACRSKRSALNKNGRIALATVVLNYSILAVQRDLDKTLGGLFVDLLQDLLSDEDPEVLYRTLYATGNILMSPNVIGALSTTTVEGLRKAAMSAGSRVSEERITSLCRQVSQVRG